LKEDLAQLPSGEWELKALLDIFPPAIRQALVHLPNLDDLIEVILDLGRLPEARFPHDYVYLSQARVTAEDISAVADRVGEFGKDNRAGIEQTLHRISCLRNRGGKIVGLTCRVGRAVYGTIDIILDVVRSGKSILLLGKPGVGKTTMLREVARVLSGDLRKRVVIVDTSNEIAGDGDVPHAGIGHARRMQVDTPINQHAVMIEAVENHMPEAIVIDEIGTEAEALAARTIAERGVQLIGTAHGIDLENILMNPTLSDLLGGIGAVTLSDEEAKRRGTRKTVLERKAPPTFDVVIEIQDRNRLAIHAPVADVVDSMLRGHEPRPEIRVRNDKGGVEVVQEAEAQTVQLRYASSHSREREVFERHAAAFAEADVDDEVQADILRIFPYGVSRSKIERAIGSLRVPALIARKWDDADVVLTLKALERRDNGKLREIASQNIPIYALKTNTTAQIQTCLKELYDLPTVDEEELALREAEEAVYKVMLHHKPVELSPQSSYIRRLQHQLAEKYHLQSRSTGIEPNRRVRIFKDSPQ
jgi:stage III sporulation protein SpoIIIAA